MGVTVGCANGSTSMQATSTSIIAWPKLLPTAACKTTKAYHLTSYYNKYLPPYQVEYLGIHVLSAATTKEKETKVASSTVKHHFWNLPVLVSLVVWWEFLFFTKN